MINGNIPKAEFDENAIWKLELMLDEITPIISLIAL